ncbi:MAG TPA: HAMP domain-containing sensor histidine kinase [Polyangia bacterium]|nr:HAMP domain-containing sensor histidine kinase [Polyangia bacterium]
MKPRIPERTRKNTPVIGRPTLPPRPDESSQELRLKRELADLRLMVEQMQQQLARRDQLASLGRLVAGVAHEIGNPLAGMSSMFNAMKGMAAEGAPLRPEAAKDIRDLLLECERAADRMGQLVTSLRDMGRLAGDEDVVFDPARAIRDAVRLFAAAKRRECHVDLVVSALPPLKASPGRLGQVIVNLLQNGLDASGPEARLEVRAESADGDLRLLVADHGHGIPPEIAPRLFERFFTTRGSAGLGLALCHDIVTSMRGSIDFESGPAGTTFRVVVPGHRLGGSAET